MQRLLVVLDCDSTLIQEEVIELIADLVGVRQEVAAVTEQAMRGELDFRESLTSRVRLLQGASLDDVRSCAARVHPSLGSPNWSLRSTQLTVRSVWSPAAFMK